MITLLEEDTVKQLESSDKLQSSSLSVSAGFSSLVHPTFLHGIVGFFSFVFFVFISVYALWVGLNGWFLVGLMQLYCHTEKNLVSVEQITKKFACLPQTSVKMISLFTR